jgi:hypothetical protein
MVKSRSINIIRRFSKIVFLACFALLSQNNLDRYFMKNWNLFPQFLEAEKSEIKGQVPVWGGWMQKGTRGINSVLTKQESRRVSLSCSGIHSFRNQIPPTVPYLTVLQNPTFGFWGSHSGHSNSWGEKA